MGLESTSFFDGLDETWPTGNDPTNKGDDHIRLLKNVIKNVFPGVGANGFAEAITANEDELNILDGATLTTAELNLLVGLTASLSGLTSTAAELNKLDGATVSTAELNKLTGSSGAAMFAGDAFAKTSGAMTFEDGVKILFGTGGLESELSSDGTNTIWNFFSDKDLILQDATVSRFLFDISVGDFHADGDIVAFSTSVGSDPKLKKDIQSIQNAADKVKRLEGVTFKWKKNGEASAGLLSDAVERVLPEAVKTVDDISKPGETYQSVNYNAVVGLLVGAINELSDRVKFLERDKYDNAS
jgi:hypothetical protein